jgi:hypothetical protein
LLPSRSLDHDGSNYDAGFRSVGFCEDSAPDSKIALGAVGDLRDRVCDHHVHHDGNQEGFEVVEVQRSGQLRLREDDASTARPFIRRVIDAIIAGGVDAEFEEDLLAIFDFSAKSRRRRPRRRPMFKPSATSG